MKTALIVTPLLVVGAICTFVFGQTKPAAQAKWEYAVAATLQSAETKGSLASWKAPNAPVVSIEERADEENSQGNALVSLDTKLLGARPPTGFPGAAVAGLLSYAGTDGWELSSVESHGTYKGTEMIFVFKRPVH